MVEDVTQRRMDDYIFFVFFAPKKSILVASQNRSLATDVTWTVLQIYLQLSWT